MTLEQIKAAVESGKTVYWKNDAYRVVKDRLGQWLLMCSNGSATGLTWQDGVTLNGSPEDFYDPTEADRQLLAALES